MSRNIISQSPLPPDHLPKAERTPDTVDKRTLLARSAHSENKMDDTLGAVRTFHVDPPPKGLFPLFPSPRNLSQLRVPLLLDFFPIDRALDRRVRDGQCRCRRPREIRMNIIDLRIRRRDGYIMQPRNAYVSPRAWTTTPTNTRMTYHGCIQSEKYSLYTVDLSTALSDARNAMNRAE